MLLFSLLEEALQLIEGCSYTLACEGLGCMF